MALRGPARSGVGRAAAHFSRNARSGPLTACSRLFRHQWTVRAVTVADMVARLLCGHAAHSATLLRRWRLAFHHLQLLSPPGVARHASPSGSVSDRAGAGAQALSVRRCRLRGHARAHSLADQRTAGKDSFDRDASSQTWICATRNRGCATTRGAPRSHFSKNARSGAPPYRAARLAETVL